MSKNKSFFILLPLIVSLIFAGGLYIGNKLGNNQTYNGNKAFNLPLGSGNKLNDIINYIDNEYVDDVQKEALLDEAIQNILQNLDPHSYYITAAEIQALNEPLEGSFDGIGVQFSIQKDTVVVITPVNGGPSEKVGVKAGDRIVAVNEEIIAGVDISNRKVMKLLKGVKGSTVNITVLRNQTKTVDFTISRDAIPIYSVDVAYMLNQETGYLKISRFAKNTYNEFLSSSTKLVNAGMQNMVLDLRGNGGGYMDAATNIIDEFLPKGSLIVYTEGRARPRKSYKATSKNSLENIELIVLIDESSASASEIIAGAIQDNDRGLIVGRRSFGKGLVQEQSSWSDGSATRLTIARYYTPSGRCIQRPYDNGTEDYHQNMADRISNGELYEKDSIPLSETLAYKTTNGRTVYGGGGITPDVFVPVDTVGYTFYFSELIYRGAFYRFAFNYSDKNRNTLGELGNIDTYERYFNSNSQIILSEFLSFADSSGVVKNDIEYTRSKGKIISRLKAQIARNIWDDEGFYPLYNQTDYTINKALGHFERPLSLTLRQIESNAF
jgi:carboxyl-terminal processing protease